MESDFEVKNHCTRTEESKRHYTSDEYRGIMRGSCTNWENGYSMPEEELIEDTFTYSDTHVPAHLW